MSNLDEQIARLEDELRDTEEMKRNSIRYAEQRVQNVTVRYDPLLQRIRDKLFALKAEKAQIEMQDADVTDKEVPGEREAWDKWTNVAMWTWNKLAQEEQSAFRAALRVAIEADRKQRSIITRADLEKAAEKSCGLHSSPGAWDRLPDKYRDEWIGCIYTAFEAVGIKVEGKD